MTSEEAARLNTLVERLEAMASKLEERERPSRPPLQLVTADDTDDD
jgi:nitrogen-specific signal transduction histidine kinase